MKYICDVCGYVYDEVDFLCPLCGVGKDQFSVEE